MERLRKKPTISLKVLLFAAVLLCGSFSMHTYNLSAQMIDPDEGDGTSTGSGAGLEETTGTSGVSFEDIQQQAAAQLWAVREQKAEAYRTEVLQFSQTQKAFDIVKDKLVNQQAELRGECRDDLRTANKFTLLPKTELCWRKDLELESTMLSKERDYLEQVPGIQDDIRQLALTRNALLTDAIDVVINAIDNQVYVSVEELEEVKQALATKYRTAKWAMDIRVQADLLLTRTNSIILRIGDVIDGSDLTIDQTNALIDSLNCFAETEQKLVRAVDSTGYENVKNLFAEASTSLQICSSNAKLASQGIVITEEPTEEQTSSEQTHSSAEEPTTSGGTGERNFLIHGLDGETNNIDYDQIKADYSWMVTPGYQTEGPDAANCDLSGLSRKLLSRMPRDEEGNIICRVAQ